MIKAQGTSILENSHVEEKKRELKDNIAPTEHIIRLENICTVLEQVLDRLRPSPPVNEVEHLKDCDCGPSIMEILHSRNAKHLMLLDIVEEKLRQLEDHI